MNTSPVYPSSGAEVLWLALAFLSLPVTEQRALVEGRASEQPRLLDGDLLPYVIEDHTVEWQEEFEPCPSLELLLACLRNLPFPPTYEQFLTAVEWSEARRLAAAAIREAGLPQWSFSATTRLADFVEVHETTPRANWPR